MFYTVEKGMAKSKPLAALNALFLYLKMDHPLHILNNPFCYDALQGYFLDPRMAAIESYEVSPSS